MSTILKIHQNIPKKCFHWLLTGVSILIILSSLGYNWMLALLGVDKSMSGDNETLEWRSGFLASNASISLKNQISVFNRKILESVPLCDTAHAPLRFYIFFMLLALRERPRRSHLRGPIASQLASWFSQLLVIPRAARTHQPHAKRPSKHVLVPLPKSTVFSFDPPRFLSLRFEIRFFLIWVSSQFSCDCAPS